MSFDSERNKVGRQPLRVLELDLDFCDLTYGIAPCTATLAGPSPTGDRKCYNTFFTCQDRPNYDPSPKTYVFSEAIENTPLGINIIPCIKSIQEAPTKVDIEGGLGARATVTITLRDFPWPDRWLGIDKYIGDRSFNTETNGTFWGKFLARNRYYEGRTARVRKGYVTDTWDWNNFEDRSYVIDKIDGPSASGDIRITLKDPLVLALDKKAQAPKPSRGELSANISAAAVSFTLVPAGIGDLEYPASGKVRIGSEVIEYASRVADVFSGLTRGSNNTTAAEHQQDDTVQLCKEYTAQQINLILEDLLTNFTTIDASFIDSAAWQQEADNWLTNTFSALITEPEGVSKLIKELNENAGFYIWWDQRSQKIEFRAVKPASTTSASFSDENFIENSMTVTQQVDKRLSQVWFYFGQIDPTKRKDETDNYARLFVDINSSAETINAFNNPKLKKIFSRWIPAPDEDTVLDATARYLSVFEFPPRVLNARIDPKDLDVWTGDNIQVNTRIVQNDTGSNAILPMIVQEVKEDRDILTYKFFENNFITRDLGEPFEMIISESQNNFNLREQFKIIFGEIFGSVILNVTIESGVVIGSTNILNPAFLVNGFASGSNITIINNGRIQGKGGIGGKSGVATLAEATGQDGGLALKVEQAISFDNLNGEIWGGGGGGGAGNYTIVPNNAALPLVERTFKPGGGGGGCGSLIGIGGISNGYRQFKRIGLSVVIPTFFELGNPGANGTDLLGGAGGIGPVEEGYNVASGDGGSGGDPGQAGQAGTGIVNVPHATADGGAPGGSAGTAVEGDSNITWVNFGSRLGPIVA